MPDPNDLVAWGLMFGTVSIALSYTQHCAHGWTLTVQRAGIIAGTVAVFLIAAGMLQL